MILLLSLLAEEQEISDKLERCTFEGADELAVQRVIGVTLSAGEKKNAPESIVTIVARPMVALPAISSGVFGVPINVCAIAMLNAIEVFLALNKLNVENKEEGAKTKERKRNNQKKKLTKNITI
ncbi:uncharacterized protein LOC122958763 [Acropora millepora]|uniref:uncharacterized protein LOC122958763 n=1 Tax=Acropora millepora TaxID=45264 RepID=UPI001CF416A7|nr:uncharacterized protein LOC122958763 [Acropora millepora]